MKKILSAAAFALFASTQAFAIIGVGAHYVYNTGSLDANSGTAYSFNLAGESHDINVHQKNASGLQGLGFKAWIDFLPFVDVEGTLNIAATRYETVLEIPTIDSDGVVRKKPIPLTYSPDAPYNMIFDKASPLYGIVSGDLTVTYPFDDLPIIRPYIGLGVSYIASIPIVNSSFTKKMLDSPDGELATALTNLADPNNTDPAKDASKIGDALVETLKNSDYSAGIGGHAIVGVRAKLPIIPIAVYANGKYYFGGDVGSQFTQGFVLEVGGGFAL